MRWIRDSSRRTQSECARNVQEAWQVASVIKMSIKLIFENFKFKSERVSNAWIQIFEISDRINNQTQKINSVSFRQTRKIHLIKCLPQKKTVRRPRHIYSSNTVNILQSVEVIFTNFIEIAPTTRRMKGGEVASSSTAGKEAGQTSPPHPSNPSFLKN